MSNPFRYFKTSPEIIRLAVMTYIRFPLSLRNVEDLLHERGIDINHETVRYWWNRFGPLMAREIKKPVQKLRQVTQWRWHLDEVFVKINGEIYYLWRAVDHEGEVLESYVTKTRDKTSALKFLKKAMKRYGRPEEVATDRLRSYPRFRQMRSLQKFAAAHASVHNHLNHDRSLERRPRFKTLRNAALAEWRQLLAG